MLLRKLSILSSLIFILSIAISAQTKADDDPLKVTTEEIKVNISAFDERGNFAEGLKKEDIVISENNTLHQASSLRRTPANVLIMIDVGNEIGLAKDRKTTLETLDAFIGYLKKDDSVAIMQYGDKAEILFEWTADRSLIRNDIRKKIGFGKRSAFVEGLNLALGFFQKTPTENRHLILIGDGTDSFYDSKAKSAAIRNLLSTDINFHVISYTRLAQKAVSERMKSLGGTRKPVPLPPGAEPPVRGTTKGITLGSVNLDREMAKKIKAQQKKLEESEAMLADLAESSNGEIFLPDDAEEMIAKTELLAKNIDSQYVLTYIPKRPLFESPDGEVRDIRVSSRRAGVLIESRKKFIVKKADR